MFSIRKDASKVALAALDRVADHPAVSLIDCQVSSPHLLSLGAREIPRADFLLRLQTAVAFPDSLECRNSRPGRDDS